MTLVLGIDPGSQITGYGFVQSDAQRHSWVASGHIKTDTQAPMPERLLTIYEALLKLIEKHQPEEVAIEDVFVARSAAAALKLGQARASALLAAASAGLPVSEYQPRKVKKSVVGTGGATKEQVQLMVRLLLKMRRPPQADAADALALAICHANHRHIMSLDRKITRPRQRRQSLARVKKRQTL